ncbi:MAG: hypothetical protein U9O53_00695 [archaeon]|nr:hypothetical protein [archaeon]
MLEYFVFILMIIAGVAIIAFALDKKKKNSKSTYVGVSSKGTVAHSKKSGNRNWVGRKRYAPEPENPDKRYDSLFSKKKDNKKDRYRKIMERRKNIRPGEVEMPINAWGKGSGEKNSGQNNQAPRPRGKYGHLFSSNSSASTSKLAKLKQRAMEVYEEQYTNKEDTSDKEEKPSIFSMFGGGNSKEKTPPTPPPVQSSFEPEMRREEVQPLPERLPERESIPNHTPAGFGSFRSSETDPSSSSGMPQMPEDNSSRLQEQQPKENDNVTKDDAFNRMLGFEPKKEEIPKKKNDNEWTPMF